jgi:hypothetical protein
VKLRFAFLGSLLFFGIIGYWGHDLPTLNSPAEALPESVVAPPASVDQVQPDLSDNIIEMALSLAGRSRYVDAIALLQTIPTDDKNYAKANRLQDLWGEAILILGQAKLKQGKTSEGKAILKSVPKTTKSYTEANKLLRNF